MNHKVLSILFFTGWIGLSGTAAYAQKPDPDADVNMWAQHPVKVDGISNEWHEPLNNFNSATDLAFALANDEQNLYLIIESLDEHTTSKLLHGGLTLNINTAGKKKDGVKINFLGMHQPPRHSEEKVSEPTSHQEAAERDFGVHAISVSGFKNIPDGELDIPNQNGIQIAAAFDQQKDYICELAIPLAQLDLKDGGVKGIAYQIKFNMAKEEGEHHRENKGAGAEGMSGSGSHGSGMGGGMRGGGGHGGGGRRGSMGGGMGGRGSSSSAGDTPKASDFWIKYQLAKPDDAFKIN